MLENKAQIFIVDDSPININFLGSALEDDYDIRASTSGKDALLFLEENTPDLILLDVMMPNMDGYQLIKKIKNNNKYINIPVIFVTSLDDSSSELKGFKLGAVDYITKPISPELVKIRIKNHLLLKQQHQQIFKQHTLFESVFEAISDGVIVYDEENRVTAINSNMTNLWGNIIDTDGVVGKLIQDVFTDDLLPVIDHDKEDIRALSRYIMEPLTVSTVDGIIALDDEKYYHYFGAPLEREDVTQGGVLCFKDLSKEINLQKSLEDMAIRDELTSLYNRRYFNTIAEREMFNSKRYGTMLGVLMVDIDYFKKVNDTWGHSIGDAVLVAVAKTMNEQIRNVDFCFRYGGEEFIILLPNITESGLIDAGKRIMRNIKMLKIEKDIQVTVSIGGSSTESLSSNDRDTMDNVVNLADDALYSAKGNGRDRMYLAGNNQAIINN